MRSLARAGLMLSSRPARTRRRVQRKKTKEKISEHQHGRRVTQYDIQLYLRIKGTLGIPAVALTTFARAEERKRAILAGFQSHLAKPFDMAELVIVLAGLLRRP